MECQGNIYQIGMGCCVPVVANANAYYTKSEVDEKIDGIVVSGDVTSAEVQTMIDESISGKADSSSLATVATSGDYDDLINKPTIPTVPTNVSAFVNDVPYLTEHQSLSGYVTDEQLTAYTYNKTTIEDKIASAKNEVENEIPSLNGYATEQWVEDKHYISGVDLSDYATINYVNGEVSGKVSTSDFNTYSGEVSTQLGSKASQSNLDTLNGIVSAHTANTIVHTTQGEKDAWNAKSNFSGSYNDLTDKPTIPTVPTSNTAFTNDAQYATSGYVDSVASGKVDISSVTSAVTSGSSDVITSGGVYQQMSGIKLVKITQSAYDALTTKDANTLYIVNG